MPKAAGLAVEIKKKFAVEPELIPGSGGVFEVMSDGRLIFSKKALGRFPEHEEIFAALAKSG